MFDRLMSTFFSDAAILSKANVLASAAKESTDVSKLIEAVRICDPSVTSLADVSDAFNSLTRKYIALESSTNRLQNRCEEAELSRDMFMGKEKLLLEENLETTTVMDDLKARLEEYEGRMGAMQAECQQLQVENAELCKRTTQMEDEVMRLENDRKAINDELEQSYDENRSLITIKNELEQSYDENRSLSTTLQGLKSDNKQLQKNGHALTERYSETVQSLHEDVEWYQYSLYIRVRQVRSLKERLAKVKGALKESRIENILIQSHRRKLSKKLKKLWPKYYLQKATLLKKEEEFTSLNESHEATELLLTSQAGEMILLEEQLAQKCGELDSLRVSIQQMVSEEVKNSLEAELTQSAQLLCKCRKDLDESRREVDQYSQENQKLQSDLSLLQTDKSILQLKYDKLSTSIEEQLEINERLYKIKVEKLLGKIQELSDDSQSEWAGKASQLKTENIQLNSKLADLEQEQLTKSRELQEQDRQMVLLQTRIIEIEKESANKLEHLEKVLSDVCSHKESVENEMENLLQECTIQGNLCKELSIQNEAIKVREEEMQLKYNANILALQKQLADLQTCEKDSDIVSIEALYQQIEGLETELSRRDALVKEVSDSRKALERQIMEKEGLWEVERVELTEWLKSQEQTLQALTDSANCRSTLIESNCETDALGHHVAVESDDCSQIMSKSIVDCKNVEIEKIRQAMNNTMRSIRDEHAAILTLWHNLGSRVYRDAFYNRL